MLDLVNCSRPSYAPSGFPDWGCWMAGLIRERGRVLSVRKRLDLRKHVHPVQISRSSKLVNSLLHYLKQEKGVTGNSTELSLHCVTVGGQSPSGKRI